MAEASSMASFASRDYFSLFGLPVRFAIDLAALESAWRAVQGAVHPDKFVAANDAQKLLALQMSTQINEAHKTLKNPILRASYICKLHGVAIDPERNTAMPADFLVQQMEWRESLEDAAQAGNVEAMAELGLEVAGAVAESEVLIEHLLDQPTPDLTRASDEIRRLMFLTKFSEQVRSEQKRLSDGAFTNR
jgi:molecular chaperone HscB